jgi:hypothetical protein
MLTNQFMAIEPTWDFFLGGYTTFTKNYVGFVSQNDVYGIPVYHKIAVSILGYQIFRQSIYI